MWEKARRVIATQTLFVRRLLGARRAWLAILTNGMSSLGNLALFIAVARSTDLSELGRFSVAFALYAVSAGVVRAAVAESVLTHAEWRSQTREASSRVVALSSAAALPITVAGALLGSSYLILVGLLLPGLVLFDHLKTIDLAVGSGRRALLRETVWTVTQVGALVATGLSEVSAVLVFALWAIVGAVIGLGQAHRSRLPLRPRWQLGRSDSRTAAFFGADYLAGSGVAQATPPILAVAAGTEVVGALRGAGTLIGPVGLIASSARSLLIPFILRSSVQPPAMQRRIALGASATLVAVVAPIGLAIAMLPDHIGELALGPNWAYAAPLLAPLAVELCFAVAATVPFAGHRVARAGRRTLVIRAGAAPVRIAGVLGGAELGGAYGAAVALAILAALTCAVWWASYLTLISEKRRSES